MSRPKSPRPKERKPISKGALSGQEKWISKLCSEEYGQAHLFEHLPSFHKSALATQFAELDAVVAGGLREYVKRARRLIHESMEGTNPFEGYTPTFAPGEDLSGSKGPGSEEWTFFERLGLDNLHLSCFCLVAGGLGERLGYPGIKISIPAELTTGVCFLELYIKYILAFQAHARSVVHDEELLLPFAIMTSGDTHVKTIELLEANGYFGMQADQVTVMEQAKVPALEDPTGKFAMDPETGLLLTKPHGHGDVHTVLHQHGLPPKWLGEDREYLLIFQDTNPLCLRSFCAALGVTIHKRFVMNSICVPRVPGESIGAVMRLVASDPLDEDDEIGEYSVTVAVEYNQLDALLKMTPLGGDNADETGRSPYPGGINNIIFRLEDYRTALDQTGGVVPEFINPKYTDAERTEFKAPPRLECMMQDFPRLLPSNANVGWVMMDRWACFTCVKNAVADAAAKYRMGLPSECALYCEANIYLQNAKLLRIAGVDVNFGYDTETVEFFGVKEGWGARVVALPSWAATLEQMKEKVRGEVTISNRSSLILDGDVVLEGLDLDGALELRAKNNSTLIVRGARIKTPGAPLAAVEKDDEVPPHLQIRGYQVPMTYSHVISVSHGCHTISG